MSGHGVWVLVLLVGCARDQSCDDVPCGQDTGRCLTAESVPVVVVGDAVGVVGEIVTLSAAESHDPDGTELVFSWELTSAPPLSTAELAWDGSAIASFVPDRGGFYIVRVGATDGVYTVHDTAAVEVVGTDSVPVADAGEDRIVLTGSQEILDGSGSYDPSGGLLSYQWTLLSSPAESEASVLDPQREQASLVPDLAGDYTVQLFVHNGSHLSEPDEVVLTTRGDDSTLPGDVPGGVLEPGSVYIFGTVRPGSSGYEAIAHWSNPDLGGVGFDDVSPYMDPTIRADGTVLYVEHPADLLREFHCDDCTGYEEGDAYPADPLANDTRISTWPCSADSAADDLDDFLLNPDDDLLARCYEGWYLDGVEVIDIYTAGLLAFGYEGKVLGTSTWDVLIIDVDDGSETEVTGLEGDILTVKAQPTGFWVAMDTGGGEVGVAVELWLVDYDTGVGTLVGEYPEPPADHRPTYAEPKLDRDGTLFQVAYGPIRPHDTIIRRRLDGYADTVYTEADEPVVQLHISRIFTGP